MHKEPRVKLKQEDIDSAKMAFSGFSLEGVIQRAKADGYVPGEFVQIEMGMHHGGLILYRRENRKREEWDAVITSSQHYPRVMYLLYKKGLSVT
ncbi:MAG TPA: hypothetical protein VJI46_00865 [Candidatus Nanoarchaeia archaeon]|nr:hypothetical protein [Candidatus Nanoarchaeia archaeon]